MSGTKRRRKNKSARTTVRSANHSVRRNVRAVNSTQLRARRYLSAESAFDDVPIRYDSGIPSRLDAWGYIQGNQVELGSNQERHMAYELGHVVQQKMGTVRANAMHSSGVALNVDAQLEHKADEIEARKGIEIARKLEDNSVVQRCEIHEGGLESVREQLLNSVSNEKLKKCINEMYRPGATTGDGGLADAIRHEVRTGTLVGGKSHIRKGQERVKNLEHIINKKEMNEHDSQVAAKLLDDLVSALKEAEAKAVEAPTMGSQDGEI